MNKQTLQLSTRSGIGSRMRARRSTLRKIVDRLREVPLDFDLSHYERLLKEIGARERHLKLAGNQAIQMLSRELKRRARSGSSLDDLLVEACALVREAAGRT